MKPKRILSILIVWQIFSLSTDLTAQTMSNWFPQMKVASPEVYSLNKFGDIPVNEYTGIPNITIPLYTIELDKIKLPINLTYHAGGIKVSEEASWVGLGWDLSLGNITQIVNGLDDFSTTYPMYLPDYIYSKVDYPGNFEWYDPSVHTDNDISKPYDPIYYSAIIFRNNWMPQNGFQVPIDDYYYVFQKDSEPDIMKANFFGQSLLFIKRPGLDSYLSINKKGYIIQRIELLNNEFGWIITSPDGTKYFFEDMGEIYTSTYTPAGNEQFPYNILFKNGIPNDNLPWTGAMNTLSRDWQITKIVTVNHDTVFFRYNSEIVTRYDYNYSFDWNIYKGGEMVNYGGWSGGNCQPIEKRRITPISKGAGIYDFVRVSKTTIRTKKRRINRIDFNRGYLQFVTEPRSDYNGAFSLNKINLYNHSWTLIKRFEFYYSYFQSNLNGGYFPTPKTDNEDITRLRLDSLRESGTPPYKFEYNSGLLPRKNSFAVDYWGYFNGEFTNTSNIPNILFMQVCTNQEYFDKLDDNNNINTSSLEYAEAATIKKLVYPTGGFTFFEYELNTFKNQDIQPKGYIPALNYFPNLDSTIGQGLRVRNITHYTSDQQPVSKITYQFQGGKTIVPLHFKREFDEGYYGICENGCLFYHRGWNNLYIQSSNLYAIGVLGSGSFVGYDAVSIAKDSINDNFYGRVIKYFTNHEDYYQKFIDSYKVLAMPTIKYQIENGLVLKEDVYSNKNVQLSSTSNFYSYVIPDELFYGARFDLQGQYACGGNDEFTNNERRDMVAYYPIIQTTTLLDSTISIEYFENSQPLTRWKRYKYDNIDQLLSVRENLSDKIRKIKYLYPNEAQISTLYSEYERYRMNNLVGLNRLSEKVGEIEMRGSWDAEMVRNWVTYDTANGLIHPQVVKNWTNGGSVNTEIIFQKYNNSGRTVQFLKRGKATTSVIWGYNNTLPIAKIENASFDLVEAELTAMGYSIESLQSKSDPELRSIFDLLRGRPAMKDAMITSYTHKTLVGMTSETDPSGKTTFYEYDNFGRLQYIKNHEGHYIKEYKYHYGEDEQSNSIESK